MHPKYVPVRAYVQPTLLKYNLKMTAVYDYKATKASVKLSAFHVAKQRQSTNFSCEGDFW